MYSSKSVVNLHSWSMILCCVFGQKSPNVKSYLSVIIIVVIVIVVIVVAISVVLIVALIWPIEIERTYTDHFELVFAMGTFNKIPTAKPFVNIKTAITLRDLFFWLIAVALYYTFTGSLMNLVIWPKLKSPSEMLDAQPIRVSILIPARNEAEQIEQLIRQLLAQTYGAFLLYVLDDRSIDATVELARAAGGDDPRLELIEDIPLPVGGLGKKLGLPPMVRSCHG